MANSIGLFDDKAYPPLPVHPGSNPNASWYGSKDYVQFDGDGMFIGRVGGDSASHESHLMSWLRDEQSNCNPRWRLR